MKEYDPEQFRKEGHAVVDLLADYLNDIKTGEGYPVLPHTLPDELAEHFSLNKESSEDETFKGIIKEFIHYSNHLHHPGYIGHQCTPPLPYAALLQLTAALLNNGSAVYEMGPANMAMERAVIKHLASKIGYTLHADGVMTHGGSAGNLTALLAARQAKCNYNIWNEGVKNESIPAFLVSEQSHYSIARNLKIMGLGEAAAWPVPSGSDFRMDTSSLGDCLLKARKKGLDIIGVVANACSTATGTYDDLPAAADFCRKHNLWLHVDGAHGLGVLFSGKYRHLAEGIELADSVIIDFHKMFMIPGLNTAVIFRDGDRSYETFAQKASYLFNETHEHDWYNGAKRTLECTKSSMGFVAWSIFRYYGDDMFGDYVNQMYDTTLEFALMIQKEPDFELLNTPESNILCFRHTPEGKAPGELNAHNKKLRKEIIEEGSYYIVQAEVNALTWLRTTIINPATSINELRGLLEKIRDVAGNMST